MIYLNYHEFLESILEEKEIFKKELIEFMEERKKIFNKK